MSNSVILCRFLVPRKRIFRTVCRPTTRETGEIGSPHGVGEGERRVETHTVEIFMVGVTPSPLPQTEISYLLKNQNKEESLNFDFQVTQPFSVDN